MRGSLHLIIFICWLLITFHFVYLKYDLNRWWQEPRFSFRIPIFALYIIIFFNRSFHFFWSPESQKNVSKQFVQKTKAFAIRRLYQFLVGTTGFEPAASCTPCKRATGLRYVPKYTNYLSSINHQLPTANRHPSKGCKSKIKNSCPKMNSFLYRIFAQFLLDEAAN